MIILSPQDIGKGYRQLQLEEPIKTTDQWFSVMHQSYRQYPWRVSQYYTNENKKHEGKVPYRRPVSLFAHISSFIRAFPKYIKFIKVKFLTR